MRKLYVRIKRSKLFKKYMADGAVVSFLKRVKHFLERVLGRWHAIFKKHCHNEQILPLLESFLQQNENSFECLFDENTVDVIVPIYNGYDYLMRLFMDLPEAGMKCRFILVDDRSTDPRVLVLERDFVRGHRNAILLENTENIGFVKSVNRG